jgi:hypothetical protein
MRMDPVAIAASVVPLLATYVGERAAQHVGDAIGQSAMTSLARIYEYVKAKVTSKSSAQDALRSLEHKPDDGRRRMALEVQLEDLIKSDPSFGEALQRLAEDARREGGLTLTQIADTGAVAIQGNVYQQGKNVAGRDLTLG